MLILGDCFHKFDIIWINSFFLSWFWSNEQFLIPVFLTIKNGCSNGDTKQSQVKRARSNESNEDKESVKKPKIEQSTSGVENESSGEKRQDPNDRESDTADEFDRLMVWIY